MVNVGKYTSPMDAMGMSLHGSNNWFFFSFLHRRESSNWRSSVLMKAFGKPPMDTMNSYRNSKVFMVKNHVFNLAFLKMPTGFQNFPSWWLNQPIWKIWVKLDHLPKCRGEKEKNMWVATTWSSSKVWSWILHRLPRGNKSTTNLCAQASWIWRIFDSWVPNLGFVRKTWQNMHLFVGIKAIGSMGLVYLPT